jgi:hypothetical protein
VIVMDKPAFLLIWAELAASVLEDFTPVPLKPMVTVGAGGCLLLQSMTFPAIWGQSATSVLAIGIPVISKTMGPPNVGDQIVEIPLASLFPQI